MPVKKGEDGERSVEAEVEVPGSPEQVWRAIATAEGISAWFMPTTSEVDDEGVPVSMTTSFGPGMDAVVKVAEWNPPHDFVAEAESEAEGGPGTVATEWIVEARDGGKCVVRVVHRWFADSDDWDGEFEGHAYGWASSFFRILRIYLTHFAGQACSAFDLTAFSRAPGPQTWRTVKGIVAIDEHSGRAVSAPGAPELSGVVESTEVDDPELLAVRERSPQIAAALEGMGGDSPELVLRLDRPAPGVAHVFTMPMGEQTMVSVRFFLYGDRGVAVSANAKREWSDWLAMRFPAEVSE
jgi:uncharacterized protein YndB with AHSA1/START domain